MRRLAAAAVVVWAVAARAEPLARFFVMGDGRLALQNVHSGARADVRYRRGDGTYDDAALARLRAVFARDRPGPLSLRLVELMSWLQDRSGSRPLRLMSGFRSPTYNEALRRRDVRAAKASLHTEGLAADIAFPHARLRDLWLQKLATAEDLVCFPQLAPAARAIAPRISLQDALENLQVVEKLQRLLATNVQEALAVEVSLLKLKL